MWHLEPDVHVRTLLSMPNPCLDDPRQPTQEGDHLPGEESPTSRLKLAGSFWSDVA